MSTHGDLHVGPLSAAADLTSASQLYRDVFGYTKPEASLNPRLLKALAANGGSMVGAWDATGALVAFGYGFVGHAGGETYFYSQAVVVADGLQGAGLGRRIKNEQRRLALADGLHRMRWAYNPVLSRNAHFNLSVLGAVGRWFVPDCYGDGESRMVVDWDLDQARPAPSPQPWASYTADDWSRADRQGAFAAVPVPVNRDLVTPQVNQALDESFSALLADGLVAVACNRQDHKTSVYLFAEADR
ncbi:putative GNAT superfamily acetyltransferase [Propionicimonas paludicola]|uniref:Putative GNAT superfamily acetyltransferase n=1 Tax=Propionicimonas paludicola TaxID=185243 RepID=A0A2A9CWW1_9ACTN|nr:hypothetical protein [Propionicimonas paludicola]PFG18120.1 putative GNAT superfamily acetyltransferase [Propionicimonas paludicola]